MLTANLVRTGRSVLDAATLEPLWACVDCRSCRTFCDHGNDVATVLMQARAELFEAGAAPVAVQTCLKAIRDNGRPGDRPASDGVTAPVEGDAPTSSIWLFLGCQGSAQDPGPAAAALNLVKDTLGDPHLFRGDLGCCGLPLWRWGDRRGFAAYAARFVSQLRGVATLVVDDPACAYALQRLYPKVGVSVPEVVTTTALLAKTVVGRPARLESWAPHDDEFAVRWLNELGLREHMRRAGVKLASGSVLEGAAGSCGGMLLAAYDPELARRVARACADDLLGGGAARILAASPTARRRFVEVGAKVDDLVSLWYEHG